jgi:hypothetical protein
MIIALLEGPDWEDLRFNDVSLCGDKGRQLIPGLEKLKAELRDTSMQFCMGKLFQAYRAAEVAEMNGCDSIPSWVTYGKKIFDITGKEAVNLLPTLRVPERNHCLLLPS